MVFDACAVGDGLTGKGKGCKLKVGKEEAMWVTNYH